MNPRFTPSEALPYGRCPGLFQPGEGPIPLPLTPLPVAGCKVSVTYPGPRRHSHPRVAAEKVGILGTPDAMQLTNGPSNRRLESNLRPPGHVHVTKCLM